MEVVSRNGRTSKRKRANWLTCENGGGDSGARSRLDESRDTKTLPPEAPPQGEHPERATLPRCALVVHSSGQAYENQGTRIEPRTSPQSAMKVDATVRRAKGGYVGGKGEKWKQAPGQFKVMAGAGPHPPQRGGG
eukprot:5483208-Amphidinium_carterae.3